MCYFSSPFWWTSGERSIVQAPEISICVEVLRHYVDVFPLEIIEQLIIMAQQSNTIDLIIQDANGKSLKLCICLMERGVEIEIVIEIHFRKVEGGTSCQMSFWRDRYSKQ